MPKVHAAPHKITESTVIRGAALRSSVVFVSRLLTSELCLAPTQVLSESEELGGSSKTPPPLILS